MGKASTIILSPALTFEEKGIKTTETKLKIDATWQPEFTPGLSVFTETGIPFYKFWKKPRKLIIITEGATRAFEYASNQGELKPHYWTLEDAKKFVAQMIAKTKGQQKPFSNWQVIGLLVGLGIVIMLQVLILRNVGGLRF